MQNAKGRVTYRTGKDTTGETKGWSKQFTAKYKAQGLSVRILEFPASADEQRQQFVQRQEARDAECDVFRSDVIWTAEFYKHAASHGGIVFQGAAYEGPTA